MITKLAKFFDKFAQKMSGHCGGSSEPSPSGHCN